MSPGELRARLRQEGRLSLAVHVIPRSPVTAWAGVRSDGSFKVRLHAVPERGRANEELVRFLAAELDIGREQVEIVAGHTSTQKQVRISL